jgi:hypothetical protein
MTSQLITALPAITSRWRSERSSTTVLSAITRARFGSHCRCCELSDFGDQHGERRAGVVDELW